MRIALTLLTVSLVLLTSACASPQAQRTVRVLDAEHDDKRIVVVTTRPAAARKCWRHGRHWHCRRW